MPDAQLEQWTPGPEPVAEANVTVSAPNWPSWAPRFLAALAAGGVVAAAASAAGISRTQAYRCKSENPEFAKKWTDALESAIDAAESELYRRAVQGVEKPVYYCGTQCGTVREYSDALLKFYLASRRRSVFGEQVQHEHSGPGGQPISVSHQHAIDKVYGEPAQVIDVAAEPAPAQLPAPTEPS
jgi:hypothetical protein